MNEVVRLIERFLERRDDQYLMDALRLIADAPSAAYTHPGDRAVAVARRFHDLYEELAPSFGYETRPESRVEFDALPRENRHLMVAVCVVVLQEMEDGLV